MLRLQPARCAWRTRAIQPALRRLCTAGKGPMDAGGTTPPRQWDALGSAHGRPPVGEEPEAGEADVAIDEAPRQRSRSAPRESGAYHEASYRQQAQREASRAEMLQFQAYVRQRLSEINLRMPHKPSTREEAELAFLEKEVIEDHMPSARREMRDPLRDVPDEDITHTNLPLICRFLSDGGAILPRRLTGVSQPKQKKLTKAIERARRLALIPPTWKLPKYRHAKYTDGITQPERRWEKPGRADDDFADGPDPRYPGVREAPRVDHDLGLLARQGSAANPFSAASTAARIAAAAARASDKPPAGSLARAPSRDDSAGTGSGGT